MQTYLRHCNALKIAFPKSEIWTKTNEYVLSHSFNEVHGKESVEHKAIQRFLQAFGRLKHIPRHWYDHATN